MTRRQLHQQTKALFEGLLLLLGLVALLAVVGPTIDAPQYEVGPGMAREIGGRDGN